MTNYANILSDARLLDSIRATITFAVPAFILEVVVGFSLALLVNQDIKGKAVFRTLMTLPLMLTPIVLAINFRIILNYDFGILNWFIGLFGLQKQTWLTDPVLAMASLIAVDVWAEAPFAFLVFAAGLATLPNEVLEAAEVDGSSLWQRLRYVVIPMMAPLFLVVALFRSYNLVRVYDQVFALTGGGPGSATETLAYHIIKQLVGGWQVGYASAMSYVLFAMSLLIGGVLILAGARRGSTQQ